MIDYRPKNDDAGITLFKALWYVATLALIVGSGIYIYQRYHEHVDATGDGPEATAIALQGSARSGSDLCFAAGEAVKCPDPSSRVAIDSTAPCDFTERAPLQAAMIQCTQTGGISQSRQVSGRECFFFECTGSRP